MVAADLGRCDRHQAQKRVEHPARTEELTPQILLGRQTRNVATSDIACVHDFLMPAHSWTQLETGRCKGGHAASKIKTSRLHPRIDVSMCPPTN